MKIRSVIVDDEPRAMKLLEEYINNYPVLDIVGKCFNATEAIQLLSTTQADLLFLDINMPGISGIELAKILSNHKIILTTAYSEYAVESYEQNVLDYLLKPISPERFALAVQKAIQYFSEKNKNKEVIFAKTGKQIVALRIQDIFYIEGLKEYLAIITAKGKTLVYKRMKDIIDHLDERFIRVHNSWIINMDFIEKVENNQVFIADKAIPIGEKYKDEFYTRVQQRLI
ncbi:MAG TPA: LytTR family DNA-binding domain-containing protein [Chitinophagaceae bacterium]|nr:LytTR family DNA-binding domain-containing protein [Chitinophagaceae bacterium]